MVRYFLSAVLVFLSMWMSAAHAKLIATDGWARATVDGQTMGGAYVTLRNDGTSHLHVLSVKTATANSAALHVTEADGGGMMTMHTAHELTVDGGETMRLAPNGTHIMLMGLRHTLSAGQVVPVTLTYVEHGTKTRKTARFKAVVRALGE